MTRGISKRYPKLYQTWRDMLRRCNNPDFKFYKYYGGRGIRVCRRWMSFENFVADMHPKPEGLQLDRIDNNDGYKPGNCRWATKSQQMRNRRSSHWMTFNGQTKTMWEWAEYLGMNPETLLCRVRKGWTVEQSLSIPVVKGRAFRRSIWDAIKSTDNLKWEAERRRRQTDSNKRRAAARRIRKREAGICIYCKRGVVTGRSSCRDHLERHRLYSMQRNKRLGLHQGKRGRPRKRAQALIEAGRQ